jgi:hypothetical protein
VVRSIFYKPIVGRLYDLIDANVAVRKQELRDRREAREL